MTQICRRLLSTCAALALAGQSAAPALAAKALANDANAKTPIKHVIVIVGENRSFDHLFATYKAPAGETVSNLLSKGIVNVDGTPGKSFADAAQQIGYVGKTYSISPAILGSYKTLPPENTAYTATKPSDTSPPPFATFAVAQANDYGLLYGDIHLLLTGASGLPNFAIDTRIKNVGKLPNGPFQLSPGVSYDDYANSPVHRFYQAWQEADCAVAHATTANPSGCKRDLFPWVETVVGAGANGKPRPTPFNEETTGEGATAMGFYNMAQGDGTYLKSLAAQYTMSDNYHQPVMGGTTANSIMLGAGDLFWYSDGKGNAKAPPTNQIEDPTPQAGTNNWYTQDGYSGGSYSECTDTSHPGIAPIENYLKTLPYNPKPNCEAGHYYLLNNYNAGYFGDGTVDKVDTFALPPSSTPTIADVLLAHNLSWRYYSEGWNAYVQNPNSPANVYCNVCSPFQYETAVMTNAAVRTTNLKDTLDFYNDVSDTALPAVAFVKPGGLNDGHPESSKFDIFEAFVKKIVNQVQANKGLANSTVIFVTTDEGGGYWDSGYIQPLDYFGDGTRIPLIAISPYTLGGHITHSYTDHVSILKFIEKNWGLPTISSRSRDNLPNPTASSANPYVPANSPAIGDLMDMFHF